MMTPPSSWDYAEKLIWFTIEHATDVVFIVKERACKSKHLQLTSGVNIFSMWTANYLWDSLQYTIVVAVTMLIFLAYQDDAFVGTVSFFMHLS